MENIIKLNAGEIQSSSSRVNWAEGLIEQLPEDHDGRNSWLLNYGVGTEANELRANDSTKRKDQGYTPRELIWNHETESLNSVT